MQEKKEETSANKTPKKTNLLDHHSIKNLLDESVTEIVKSRGYLEDARLSNVKLFIGVITIVIALFAQFYYKKFPDNKTFLIGCIISYCFFSGVSHLLSFMKEKDAILFTHPPVRSFNSTGLVVSSKLPRFSDMYTLKIASADPQSKAANPSVEFTESVTKWFTKEGVLVEGIFWRDVEGLILDYAKEGKKSK